MDNNEPGLYRDLKDVLPCEIDREALLKSLVNGEEWINAFIESCGVYVVRDLIEDLSLQRRVCQEKLSLAEDKYSLGMLAISLLKDECKFDGDIKESINDLADGDVEDYE